MSFSFEKEKDGKTSFLDIGISRENSKVVTTVYHKPTCSSIFIHFESFLLSTHKFGMLYTLVFRRFNLCSDWSSFHRELLTKKFSKEMVI